jgi:hypothetical protein
MFRLNRNSQKTNPNSLKESIFEYVSENLGLFWFVSKLFYLFRLFRIGSKHRNKPKFFVFGFTKQIEKTQSKQILFRFVSVRTDIFFFVEDTLVQGHQAFALFGSYATHTCTVKCGRCKYYVIR